MINSEEDSHCLCKKPVFLNGGFCSLVTLSFQYNHVEFQHEQKLNKHVLYDIPDVTIISQKYQTEA